jgi:DNA-binding transcriptional LysR family regulator
MAPPIRHTLDQLLVLETIARTGSFAAAARELHRVPSAVSYAVAGLEAAMGVTLFDRSGHKALLTAEGRRICAQGTALLEGARRLDALGTALSGGFEPNLSLVVDGALPMEPIIRALKAFIALGLPTRVRLSVEYQEGAIERFHQDRADILMALDLENAGAVRAEPLPPLDFVLLARNDHPLLEQERLERADLHGHTELVVRDSSLRFREAPREPWFGSAHALFLSDFPNKRLALLEGLGFGWMPQHLVAGDLASGRLRRLPLADGSTWTYRPNLAYRAESPPGPAASRLIRLLVSEASGLRMDEPNP